MKTLQTIAVIFSLFILIGGCGTVSMYNGLVDSSEAVESAWSQVENVYQRRADLIPNLVETVKGAANFEKSTLEAVIEARSKATQVNIDPKNLDANSLQKFEEAQSGLSSALSKLLVVIERYPEIKATQNFSELQAQLEGIENRIAVERKRFNETAQSYNAHRRKFPRIIIAGMFGFDKKEYFQSEEGAEKTPEVTFSKEKNQTE